MTFLLFIVMITVLLSLTVAICTECNDMHCQVVVVLLWDFLSPLMLCHGTVVFENFNLGIICYLRYSASLGLNYMPQRCMFVCMYVCVRRSAHRKKRHKCEKVWPLYTVLMFMLAQLCWRKPYHSQTEKWTVCYCFFFHLKNAKWSNEQHTIALR